VNDWTVISEYVKHFAYFTVRKDRNLVRVEDGVVEPVKKIEGGMCTAIASHYLVTYYHGTHKQFQIDEKYWICQTINLGRVIPVTVVSIKKNKDFVILHTEVELTHYSLFHGNVNGGVQFLTLGLSDRTEEGSHLSHRMGMIISGEMHAKNTVRAAVAVDGGDSGAPVVNNHYEFLGMVVSTVECKYGSDPLQDAAIHTADTNILPCGIIESALEVWILY
jgi:hypothetical protein